MSMLARFVKGSNGLEEVNQISNSLNRYRKYIFSSGSCITFLPTTVYSVYSRLKFDL